MPQKALTNHVLAPQHLLEKYAQQKHLLLTAAGQAPTPLPAATEQQQQVVSQPGMWQQQQQPPGEIERQTAAAAAAAGQGAVAAATQQEQRQEQEGEQRQQQAEMQSHKGEASRADDAAGSGAGIAAGSDAAAAAVGTAITAANAAAAAAVEEMDIEALLDAAINRHVTGAAARTGRDAGAAAAGAAAEQHVEPAVFGAGAQPLAGSEAAAAAPAPPPSAAARPAAGRRLAGLSTQHLTHPYAGAYLGGARAMARAGMPGSTWPPATGAEGTAAGPFVGASQYASGALPAAAVPDQAAIAAAAARMPWLVVGGQGSISRLQQRRLHVIMARLMEVGFVMKQVGGLAGQTKGGMWLLGGRWGQCLRTLWCRCLMSEVGSVIVTMQECHMLTMHVGLCSYSLATRKGIAAACI